MKLGVLSISIKLENNDIHAVEWVEILDLAKKANKFFNYVDKSYFKILMIAVNDISELEAYQKKASEHCSNESIIAKENREIIKEALFRTSFNLRKRD